MAVTTSWIFNQMTQTRSTTRTARHVYRHSRCQGLCMGIERGTRDSNIHAADAVMQILGALRDVSPELRQDASLQCLESEAISKLNPHKRDEVLDTSWQSLECRSLSTPTPSKQDKQKHAVLKGQSSPAFSSAPTNCSDSGSAISDTCSEIESDSEEDSETKMFKKTVSGKASRETSLRKPTSTNYAEKGACENGTMMPLAKRRVVCGSHGPPSAANDSGMFACMIGFLSFCNIQSQYVKSIR